MRVEDGEEARLLRRGLVSITGVGFVSCTDGAESLRPEAVGGWRLGVEVDVDVGPTVEALLLEGRRKLRLFGRRLLSPFRWSSGDPGDRRTAFPLAIQPRDSTSCCVGWRACSQSWIICSIGGEGEGKCSCSQ